MSTESEGGSVDEGSKIRHIIPQKGLVYTEQSPMLVLCKPKILPLKSVTLEKLEKMQKDAQETIRKQEEEEKMHETMMSHQEGFRGGPHDEEDEQME